MLNTALFPHGFTSFIDTRHHRLWVIFSVLTCLRLLISIAVFSLTSIAVGQVDFEQNTGEPRTFDCPAISSTSWTCRDDRCDLLENEINCPEDCADRNRRVMGYYTQGIVCPATNIYEPDSVTALRTTVRNIVAAGRKVKAAGSSHSATDMICADTDGDIVRTLKLKTIHDVRAYEGVEKAVYFESGVTFIELQEYLAAKNLSMGLATPGYGGITVAGAIATGAHGSSLLDHSTISSYVLSLDMVNADGDLTTYSRGTTGKTDPDLWRALLTNMGLLGIVVGVRIEVEPQYNIHMQVKSISENDFVNRSDGVKKAIAGCDYVFLTWFPGQDKVRYLCGTRTGSGVTSPHAVNQLFTPKVDGLATVFAIPSLQLAMCFNSIKGCFIESQRVLGYENSPPLVITQDSSPNSPVVSRHNSLIGLSNRMVTLHPDRFARQPALSQLEYEGAMPLSQIQNAVKYLKRIYDRDGVCQPLIGTIMRFDRADKNTLIAANSVRSGITDGEQLVHLEFVEYWGYDWNQHVYDNYISKPYTEIVTHLINNYNYWPHWGKNDEWVFTEPMVKARNLSAVSVFNKQIEKLDPKGVFSNASARRNGFIKPSGAIKPVEKPLEIFEHCNYAGDSRIYNEGNFAFVDNGWNDKLSSLKVAPGYTATLYEHDNYQGKTQSFTADSHCLVATDWNDLASSIAVTKGVDDKAKRVYTLRGAYNVIPNMVAGRTYHMRLTYGQHLRTWTYKHGRYWWEGKVWAKSAGDIAYNQCDVNKATGWGVNLCWAGNNLKVHGGHYPQGAVLTIWGHQEEQVYPLTGGWINVSAPLGVTQHFRIYSGGHVRAWSYNNGRYSWESPMWGQPLSDIKKSCSSSSITGWGALTCHRDWNNIYFHGGTSTAGGHLYVSSHTKNTKIDTYQLNGGWINIPMAFGETVHMKLYAGGHARSWSYTQGRHQYESPLWAETLSDVKLSCHGPSASTWSTYICNPGWWGAYKDYVRVHGGTGTAGGHLSVYRHL